MVEIQTFTLFDTAGEPIEPPEIPPPTPGTPTEPPPEDPPGNPQPDVVPPPIHEPGEPPPPDSLPGKTPDEIPGRGPNSPTTPNPGVSQVAVSKAVGGGCSCPLDLTNLPPGGLDEEAHTMAVPAQPAGSALP